MEHIVRLDRSQFAQTAINASTVYYNNRKTDEITTSKFANTIVQNIIQNPNVSKYR